MPLGKVANRYRAKRVLGSRGASEAPWSWDTSMARTKEKPDDVFANILKDLAAAKGGNFTRMGDALFSSSHANLFQPA